MLSGKGISLIEHLDYVILLVVGMIGIGGGLLILREAKKYRARHNKSERLQREDE